MDGATPTFVDYETRSRINLKRHGARRYAADESTSILCGVAIRGSDVWVWTPWGQPCDDCCSWRPDCNVLNFHEISLTIPPEVLAHQTFVAHNAAFDALIWHQVEGNPPREFIDSLPRARRRGLPGKLDKTGELLYGIGKDKVGQRVTDMACKPDKRRGVFIDPDAHRLAQIVRYCITDTWVTSRLWHDEKLSEPHVDDEVLRVHDRINERGVMVDMGRVREIHKADQLQSAQAIARAERHGVSATMLRSPAELRRWLAKRGMQLDDVQKPTVEGALEDASPIIEDVLRARLAICKVTSGKISAILDRVGADGRLRDMLVYYGAHTGRWSGRGFQPQNLPRPVKGLTDDIDAADAPRIAAELEVDTAQVLGSMLRGVLVGGRGGLVQCDYASIEARALCWLAGDEQGLEVYRRGEDPYQRIADRLSADRAVGKVAVLSCGYGGGAGAFSGYAEKIGLDLGDLRAHEVVEAWRDTHPKVAGVRTGLIWAHPEKGYPVEVRKGGMWKLTQEAAHKVVARELRVAGIGGHHWKMCGPHLHCVLPSRRELVYRDARIETQPNRWDPSKQQKVLTYLGNRGHRVATYGGKLVENVTQAVCRDLLAAALVRLERAGFRVVLHIHDEVLVETDDVAAVKRIMEDSPPWAVGLPVTTEANLVERYTK